MFILNWTVEVEDWFDRDTYEGGEYVILKLNDAEIWRNDGKEYVGRGHGSSPSEYVTDIIARKFIEVFK